MLAPRRVAGPVLGVRHSPPAFAVPAGACDSHVHVFGPPGRYPLAEDRVYMPSPASVDDLLGMHAALGIDRVVVVQASPQGTDHRGLADALDALNAAGHAARGVAVVRDDIPSGELLALRARGVRGLRVNLESFGQNNAVEARRALLASARLADEHGLHVQLYTNAGMVKAVADTLRRMPVPVVIDHFALASPHLPPEQPGLPQLLDLLRGGTVYLKLSAPYRILAGHGAPAGRWLARLLLEANPERLLWGTDWPHTGAWPGRPRLRDRPEPLHPVDDGQQLNHFGDWTSAAERQQVLVDNPAQLYGFD